MADYVPALGLGWARCVRLVTGRFACKSVFFFFAFVSWDGNGELGVGCCGRGRGCCNQCDCVREWLVFRVRGEGVASAVGGWRVSALSIEGRDACGCGLGVGWSWSWVGDACFAKGRHTAECSGDA
jgi:hypothetical protein